MSRHLNNDIDRHIPSEVLNGYSSSPSFQIVYQDPEVDPKQLEEQRRTGEMHFEDTTKWNPVPAHMLDNGISQAWQNCSREGRSYGMSAREIGKLLFNKCRGWDEVPNLVQLKSKQSPTRGSIDFLATVAVPEGKIVRPEIVIPSPRLSQENKKERVGIVSGIMMGATIFFR